MRSVCGIFGLAMASYLQTELTCEALDRAAKLARKAWAHPSIVRKFDK